MRRGLLTGAAAYLIWGLFPLYWPLLEPAGATEILAHRMVWSLAVMLVVLTVVRGWPVLVHAPGRTWALVAAGAVLVSINWGVYIYAVNHDQVVEAALGYFINPLVTVSLGVLIFAERLGIRQWIAVSLGLAAVVVIAVNSSRFPWVSLVLAASFAAYGLVKKVIRLPPTASLTAEGLVQFLPAVVFLILLHTGGRDTLAGHGAGHVTLLALSGVVTVIPLLAFAAAARALPLSTMGLLQFLTPVTQFLLGVFWAHEHMPTARWIGFGLVWIALIVLSIDGLAATRRSVRARDHEMAQ